MGNVSSMDNGSGIVQNSYHTNLRLRFLVQPGAFGGKWKKSIFMDNAGITEVEHLPHHLKVRALAPLDKMENCLVLWPEVTSTKVDHSSHHPKVKGLILAHLR
jgi:hypothetical protein